MNKNDAEQGRIESVYYYIVYKVFHIDMCTLHMKICMHCYVKINWVPCTTQA